MLLSIKEQMFNGSLGSAVQLDVKAVSDSGAFEGYGSVFNNEDTGGDIIVPGAFKDTLAKRQVKMLWQHDPTMPIGKWTELAEDSNGLLCKGRLFLNVRAGQEAHALMSEGAIDGLSIGYRAKSSQFDKTTGIRRLSAVDLYEVSVVTFPANESARVSMVKSVDVDAIQSLSDAEDSLREAGYSRKEARDFVSRVKRIAQREAGADQEERDILATMQRLSQAMRG